MRERHIWYALDLAGELPRVELLPGFQLIHARHADLPMLEQLKTVGRHEATQRLDGGADLWLMRDGDQTAFACWTFRDRTPVMAARDGWLALPARTVCLEDSVTSPAYRGRGLAGAAWSALMGSLRLAGAAQVITKVAEDNVPSRRAVEKAGFQPVALMIMSRIALRTRVTINLRPAHEEGAMFLATALAR